MEINYSHYTLKVFHATRIQKLSLRAVLENFGEPVEGAALTTLQRFVDVGLIYRDEEGGYFSNYPNHYVNFSNYRFDKELEAQKDAEVFERVKSHAGDREYWKGQTYFSQDGYMSKEHRDIINSKLVEVKELAKKFCEEDKMKKSIIGLVFCRLKFFNMKWAIVLMAMMFSMISADKALAGGSGNDPTIGLQMAYLESALVERGLHLMGQKIFVNKFSKSVDVASLAVRFTESSEELVVASAKSDKPKGPGDGTTDGGSGHDPTNGGTIVAPQIIPITEICADSREDCGVVVEMLQE